MHHTIRTLSTLTLIIGCGDTSLTKYGTECGEGTEEIDGVCEPVIEDTGEPFESLLPPEGSAAAAGDVSLHQGFWKFGQKDRWHRWFAHAAPQPPFAGMGEEEALFGPGDAHVAKPALLLE